MSLIKSLMSDLNTAPLVTLDHLQQNRPIWTVMICGAMFLILSAIFYFQLLLAMDPCELCVYIRFSQCCIVIAGLIILIDPKNHVLKFLGLLLAWYGITQGMLWSLELMHIHNAAHMEVSADMDFFVAAGDAAGAACSTDPKFPLNLPLNEWLPFEFEPTGGCGEDDWSLLGMNMAHYCIIAYGVFAICLTPLTIGWIKNILKK